MKETAMKTLLQTRIDFLETLAQLKHLDGPETLIQALCTVKEREVGKLCYLAEEDLPSAELSLLKDMLHLEKRRWEAYKQTFRKSIEG
jgi:hypothetical protein